MTNAQAGLISDFMHGSRAGRLSRRIVRIGFVVVFGAMSVFHFPVMAFGGDPHSGHSHAAEPSHHHDSDCGDDVATYFVQALNLSATGSPAGMRGQCAAKMS